MNSLDNLLQKLSKLDIKGLQLTQLRGVVSFHYENNPIYRSKCKELGVEPRHIKTLEDIRLLPIVERDYLSKYPFFHKDLEKRGGSIPVNELGTFLNSSGSTGKPKRIPISKRAIPSIFETSALGMWICGVKGYQTEAGGTILPIFPHGPFPGSFFLQNGAEQIGFCPKSDMGMSYDWHYENLIDLNAKYIVTSPSFISAFAKHIEKNGDFNAFNLDRIVLGGEYFSESFRDFIQRKFNCKVRDLYGCGETQIVGIESDELYDYNPGYMHHLAHMSHIEVVKPGTYEVLPRGERGEMVITVFNRYAWPVVRYRMGDIVSLPEKYDVKGSLGLPLMSRIQGRSDDMLKYGNVNLYPETLFNALKDYNAKNPELMLSGDKFQFVIEEDEQAHSYATLTIESEKEVTSNENVKEKVLSSLVNQSVELQHALYVGKQVPKPEINIVPPGSLYFKEQKLRRMLDNRNN